MTVKECISKNIDNIADWECYRYTDKSKRLHTDFIESVEHISDLQTIEIEDFWIMDEGEYDTTTLANGCIRANFVEWYGNKDAKVLVMVINN